MTTPIFIKSTPKSHHNMKLHEEGVYLTDPKTGTDMKNGFGRKKFQVNTTSKKYFCPSSLQIQRSNKPTGV